MPTLGALDMGGASAQKTHFCGEKCAHPITLHLYGGTYKVTSSSALCYGLAEAMNRFTIMLLHESYYYAVGNGEPEEHKLNNTIENPCLMSHGSAR